MAQETWLVIIYLAGDNNLSDECVYALTEMKKVLTDRVKILAMLDPPGSKLEPRYYEINRLRTPGGRSEDRGKGRVRLAEDLVTYKKPPHRFPGSGESSRIQQARAAGVTDPEPDTGSPETLFYFISWCVEQFKADRHLLILAGHGAGTEEDFLLKDESPASSLTIPELGQVFQAVKDVIGIEIDVLGLDVCLMSMAEVCYELEGRGVHYIVCSESYSPRAGWPYQQIISALADGLESKGSVEPAELAQNIVREYVRFYSDYVVTGRSVDQAALEVSASPELVRSVKALAGVLKGELTHEDFRDAIILAHWEAQSYNGEQFVDLYDFCDLLSRRYVRNGVREACAEVMRAIDGPLVNLSCFDGVKYQYSYGLSIYFPWAEVAPYYKLLRFARDTGWHDFLESYVELTRRRPRGVEEGNAVFFSVKELKLFRKTSDHGPDEDASVRSMRNPPQELAYVSPCIDDREEFIKTLERFRLR